MSGITAVRHRPWTRAPVTLAAAIGVVVVLVVVAVAAVTHTTASVPQPAPHGTDQGPLPTPLATSVVTAQGAWATVAMGRLGDPAGTFWQILHQPTVGAPWSNLVEATAVATNGGIVVAPTVTGSAAATAGIHDADRLALGVVPSELLRFSPLLATTNGGRTWASGVLTEGLAAHPSSLAIAPSGAAAAVVTGDRTAVWTTAASLDHWHPLTTLAHLASVRAARACGIQAITAVGFADGDLVVGTACRRGPTVGLFVATGNGWQSVAGTLAPRSVRADTTEVLAEDPTADGLRVVVEGAGPTGRSVWAITVDGPPPSASVGGTAWPVPAGDHLRSVSTTSAGGTLLTVSGAGQRISVEEEVSTSGPWTTLPPPPSGTATVVGTGAGLQALVVHGDVLTVWQPAGPAGWTETQHLRVDVPAAAGQS